MTILQDRISSAPHGTTMPVESPHPRPDLFEIEVSGEGLSESVPHVNNVVYLAWFDRIAELAGELRGPSREDLAARGRYPRTSELQQNVIFRYEENQV